MFTSRSFSSSSASTIKHETRSTRSSFAELPPEEVIRKGTVGSRIRQLAVVGRPPVDSVESDLADWDRSSTQSGWGRKTGDEARIVQPATHRRAIEVHTKLPPIPTAAELRSSVSLGHIRESIGLFERTSLRGQLSLGDLVPWLPQDGDVPTMMAQQTRVQQLSGAAKQSTSRPQHDSVGSSSTAADPRESAREMFAQYGIREPSGWLSDEEQQTRMEPGEVISPQPYWRICHICGAKTHSKTFCTSCGHPLCQTCTCAVPQDSASAHKGFAAARPPHLATQQSFGKPSQQPRPIPPISTATDEAPTVRSVKRSETASLKNNPFLIADRVAKRQAIAPQITGGAVTAGKYVQLEAASEHTEEISGSDTEAP
jgi:hypothetical protein